MATHHELAASVATCHWGSFDAALAPVLTIQPGARVTLHTVSGAPEVLPGPGFAVPPELASIHEELRPDPGSHILTGPIAIAGAQPGDVLEVRILEIALRQDWGWTRISVRSGGHCRKIFRRCG
jgi:acetamidase/formamidase